MNAATLVALTDTIPIAPGLVLSEFRKGAEDGFESFHAVDWMSVEDVMQVIRDFCLRSEKSISASYRIGFLSRFLACYAEDVSIDDIETLMLDSFVAS